MKEKIEPWVLIGLLIALMLSSYYIGRHEKKRNGFWITVVQTNGIVNVTATNRTQTVTTNFFLSIPK